ncbi:MAG TPA: hypothetical protein IAC31_06155 [Candidatus Faecousia intestinigallinarum]|nr:hypothetical protein [Candidatus Faecousia intestinigallinarum]
MKKTMLCLMLVLCLFLAGCGDHAVSNPANPSSDAPMPGYDAQNQYLLLNAISFQETEDFFCGSNLLDEFLHFYDKESGISGVLCTDPACLHDSAECSAYIQAGSTLSYYDGKIYWIAGEPDSRDGFLWKSDLSGRNREKVKRISFEDIIFPYQPQRYVIHRGNLYILGQASVVDDTQTGARVSLLSLSLSSDEDFTILYDETFPHVGQAVVRFMGPSIYLFTPTYRNAGSSDSRVTDLTVMKFDTQSGASEVMYQESGLTERTSDIWVTETQEFYLSGTTEDTAYLWKLENNARIELASLPVEGEAGLTLTGGIAIFTSMKADTRWVEICDLSGAAIYSGKLFPGAIPGLDGDPNAYSYGVVGGDAEKLILMLNSPFSLDENYTILLDLNNDLEGTVLWSGQD